MTYLELARWLGEDHELHDVLVVMHEAAEVAKDIEYHSWYPFPRKHTARPLGDCDWNPCQCRAE